MKKVLISRTSLPMSMQLSHKLMKPQVAPGQAAVLRSPVSNGMDTTQIPQVMCEVLTEADEYQVVKHLLTNDIYTLDVDDKPKWDAPTDEANVIFEHLYNLGISDEQLNFFHHDTLTRLYEQGALLSFDEVNTIRKNDKLNLQKSYEALLEGHKALQGDFDDERSKNEKLIDELAEFKAGAQSEINSFDKAYKELLAERDELKEKLTNARNDVTTPEVAEHHYIGDRYERKQNPNEKGRRWIIWDNKLNARKPHSKGYIYGTTCDPIINELNEAKR